MQNPILQKAPEWNILGVLKWTTGYFADHHVDSPRLTAEILLAETLGIDRVGLYVRFDQPLTEDERQRFRSLVKRRIRKEPVSYIIGRRDFWKISLAVTPDVLIPRPDTEIIVEAALDLMPVPMEKPLRFLDMGTGSGAIAISLAHSFPGPLYFASDISPNALRIAAGNAVLNGVADRVAFFASRWFDAVSAACAFDMIVSNPPYIPSGQIPHLAPEITDYEPVLALDGDGDGLRDIAVLVSEGPGFLVPGGIMILEIGHDQKPAVEKLAKSQPNWADIAFRKDYAGHDRAVVLRRR